MECKLRICEIGDNGRSDGQRILRSCPQQERDRQFPNETGKYGEIIRLESMKLNFGDHLDCLLTRFWYSSSVNLLTHFRHSFTHKVSRRRRYSWLSQSANTFWWLIQAISTPGRSRRHSHCTVVQVSESIVVSRQNVVFSRQNVTYIQKTL